MRPKETAQARANNHTADTRHHPWTDETCGECREIRYLAYRERHPIDRWVAKFLSSGR